MISSALARAFNNLGEGIFRMVGSSGVLVLVEIKVQAKTQPNPYSNHNPNPDPKPNPKRAERAETRHKHGWSRVCIEPGNFSVADDDTDVRTTPGIFQVKNIPRDPFSQTAKPTRTGIMYEQSKYDSGETENCSRKLSGNRRGASQGVYWCS